jgi:hypothetical protein
MSGYAALLLESLSMLVGTERSAIGQLRPSAAQVSFLRSGQSVRWTIGLKS